MRSTFLVVLALAGLACSDAKGPLDPGSPIPGSQLAYGESIALGNGKARTYVVSDRTGRPLEVGVALDEAALEGLPVNGSVGGGGHEHYNVYLLDLPAAHGTPYHFVELDWNPKGHGGPYTAAHFDFHFYRISRSEREAIDPAGANGAAAAAKLPAAEEIPAGYMSSHLLMNLTPAQAAVPKMGLHWIDMGSPELPPQNKPFTATFILGSWDGKVIFDEPMITREFILAHRDRAATDIPVPVATRYTPAGFYMNGYRLSFDAQSSQYRIALTGLTQRN